MLADFELKLTPRIYFEPLRASASACSGAVGLPAGRLLHPARGHQGSYPRPLRRPRQKHRLQRLLHQRLSDAG